MKQPSRKVLIIKPGYSEVLDAKIDNACSLGDVFWTTSILHHFAEDQVTWLTDAAALPLLAGNPSIKRLLIFDLVTVLQLLSERFDVVVNFEKVPGLCALADRIPAWLRYGFRFDVQTGETEAYEHAGSALFLSQTPTEKRSARKSAMRIFYEMLGVPYRGESYSLGYKPRSQETFDIGFNTEVGKKWPNKAWPKEKWVELEAALGKKYKIDFQRGLNNLNQYMDWIHSCRMVVTNDSLGLHLALAMGKKVVALFGPMPSTFIEDAPGQLIKISPDHKRFPCSPCMSTPCANREHCMSVLEVERVATAVRELLPDPVFGTS